MIGGESSGSLRGFYKEVYRQHYQTRVQTQLTVVISLRVSVERKGGLQVHRRLSAARDLYADALSDGHGLREAIDACRSSERLAIAARAQDDIGRCGEMDLGVEVVLRLRVSAAGTRDLPSLGGPARRDYPPTGWPRRGAGGPSPTPCPR